jgi:hypothetical protein
MVRRSYDDADRSNKVMFSDDAILEKLSRSCDCHAFDVLQMRAWSEKGHIDFD